jgi:hypothetical protein
LPVVFLLRAPAASRAANTAEPASFQNVGSSLRLASVILEVIGFWQVYVAYFILSAAQSLLASHMNNLY